MKKQTAIQWLESEMRKPNLSIKDILIQAKEIEKEQIKDAYVGSDYCITNVNNWRVAETKK